MQVYGESKLGGEEIVEYLKVCYRGTPQLPAGEDRRANMSSGRFKSLGKGVGSGYDSHNTYHDTRSELSRWDSSTASDRRTIMQARSISRLIQEHIPTKNYDLHQ